MLSDWHLFWWFSMQQSPLNGMVGGSHRVRCFTDGFWVFLHIWWFLMVVQHWSNDVMVTDHRSSLIASCKKDAINVIIQMRVSTLWRGTWKLISEKNQTNVTNATLHLLRQVFRGDIWKLPLNFFLNATNVTMNLFVQAISEHFWKPTLEKNHSNATNATLHLLKQEIWGHIWNLTTETNHTRETSATMHLFRQAVWPHLKFHTPEKSRANATNATMHVFWQAIWEDIWKLILEKNRQNATIATLNLFTRMIWEGIWKLTLEKNRSTMHLFWQAMW